MVERLQRHSKITAQDAAAIHALPRTYAIKHHKRDFRRPGERDDRCYVVLSGRVGSFEQGRSGSRQLASLYLPGQIVNSEAVISPVSTSGLVALSEAHVVELHVDDVLALANASASIAIALWRESLIDMSLMSKRMYGIAHLGARPHAAHLICELAMRLGDGNEASLCYDTALTQQDFAELIGITSVHLNRTLRRLREAGLVSMFAGVITIHNWAALAELAEFDPSYLRLSLEADQIAA